MANTSVPIDPVELLDALKGYPFIAPYSLAIHSLKEGVLATRGAPPRFCAVPGSPPGHCTRARCPLSQLAREACTGSTPSICHCHLGVIGFAISLGERESAPYCLVGWGVRAQSINLSYLEKLAKENQLNPFALLDQWGTLSSSTNAEVKQVAEKVAALLPSLRGDTLHSTILEKTVGQLNTIVDISEQLDRIKTVEALVKLLSESLGICFDLPMIAVALPDDEPQGFTARGTWGMPDYQRRLPQERLAEIAKGDRLPLRPIYQPELFRNLSTDRGIGFPLIAERQLLGMVLVFNVELHPRDILQVAILCDKAAVRLKAIQRELHPLLDTFLPDRLNRIIASLAGEVTRDGLYRKILEQAASLQNACTGSLMLLEQGGNTLGIREAIGINTELSRNMKLKLGEGIAGKVAATGKPILVNDIESDSRISAANRPRFKTKSFLSVPLKLQNRVIGVLNLSDKENQEIFTEADLQLLTVFTTQACILIERSELLERTSRLEELNLADPLTGLYNHSCIMRRMEEELNRSQRQKLTFSILLIEIDYLPLYAELCGQAHADAALQRIATLLTGCARVMDAVSRYRDDTFCIVLPGTSKKDAAIVAERIAAAIRSETFTCEENLPSGSLTASIGIAAFPDDGDDSAALATAAESALYQAKAQGRDRSCGTVG